MWAVNQIPKFDNPYDKTVCNVSGLVSLRRIGWGEMLNLFFDFPFQELPYLFNKNIELTPTPKDVISDNVTWQQHIINNN